MKEPVKNLLFEAYETELGGIEVYTNAVKSAKNPDLKKEWQKYLQQTKRHEQILRGVLRAVGLDPKTETPGRRIVRHQGESLVKAIQMAREEADAAAAEIVAAECVVLAETKDHQNWELIGEVAKTLDGSEKKALTEANEEVEDEEDEHLYHTQGWTRELWMQMLGMPAVLPPPEEKKDVKTAIGAARAKQARGRMAPRSRAARKKAGTSKSKPAKKK